MVDLLAIGTHPDDVEIGCGGILCREAAEGRTVVIVDLTLGQKATNGTPEIRREEALASAKLIGAERQCLDFQDCDVLDSYAGRLKIVEVIRKYKPKLVLAPYWAGVGQHPDHSATGYMVRAACRYARFAKILPELPLHWIDGILHYPPPTSDQVDFLVDVSQYVETWTKMFHCHRSQLQTYPYGEHALILAQRYGTMAGCRYAQGLVKSNPICIRDVLTVSHGVREL